MGILSFFIGKTEKQKLQEKYKTLLKESFDLSKVNRSKSDSKLAEAEKIAHLIESLNE